MNKSSIQVQRTGLSVLLSSLILFNIMPLCAEEYKKAPTISSPQWVNSPALTDEDLIGKVRLVEFWTFGCWNCEHIEPYVKSWHAKYEDNGLIVIAVHSPEFDYEKQLKKLTRYVEKHQIKYPIAVDNEMKNWRNFNVWGWPSLYLIDKAGNIRYKRVGEGGYAATERMIQTLLNE